MSKSFKKTPKQQAFLNSLPQSSIADSNLAGRCKFNFSYLDIAQEAGQSFVDWNNCGGDSKLTKLLDKLKDYTRESLKYWQNQKIGKGKRGGVGKRQNCLEIYGEFPIKSDFFHPPHVPEDVLWARFRIDNDTRLAGFVVPDKLSGEKGVDGFLYDTNTFYIVFLDETHSFYKT